MGNSSSRIDKFYGNYEKSFERLETDVQRLKARASARALRKANLSRWTGGGVALATAMTVGLIYQVQSQPHGTYTYQQHFSRIGSALALPVVAYLLHRVLLFVMSLIETRDRKRIGALEKAKRSMIKELKDMSRFDKIKALIDKFDPDSQQQLRPVAQRGHVRGGQPGHLPNRAQQHAVQQSPGQVPGLLVKGSGQVAGAAALAVAGAGKAIMPLLDKVATSLISDNPMLLEDLRRAQMQLQDAEVRMIGAVQDSFASRREALELKLRVVELEQQLGSSLSYDKDILQEQLQQLQAAQQQQLPWVTQHCMQAGSMYQEPLLQLGSSSDATAAPGSGVDDAAPSGWHGVSGDVSAVMAGAAQMPSSIAAAAAAEPPGTAAGGAENGVESPRSVGSMGEGLQGAAHDEQPSMSATGLRQRAVKPTGS